MSNSTAKTTNEMWADQMVDFLRSGSYTGQYIFHCKKGLVRKREMRDVTTTEEMVESLGAGDGVDSERVGRG